MSNISRREFLKGAGVAALAVAAAGALAGCEAPVIPDVTAKDVTVKFVDRAGNEVGSTVVKNVPLTETKMNTGSVEPPEGYVYGIVGDEFIDWDNRTVTFIVDKKATQKVTINYYSEAENKQAGEEVLYVDEEATCVNTSTFKKVPAGYELAEKGDLFIRDGYVYAPVCKKQ